MTRRPSFHALLPLAAALALAACGESATLPLAAGTGFLPQLPAPNRTLLPTVNIAPASAWSAGDAPTPAAGLAVAAYATGLDHPRWLHVLPNGDVLVAESNAPKRPEEETGLRAFVMRQVMKRAGAGVPSANRITLLRGLRPDGTAELRTVFAENLHSPFGMAHTAGAVYVANTDGVQRWRYAPGMTRLEGPGETVASLLAGPRNHHWTKALIASPDGSKLYATVGSNSNVAENGLAEEEGRAAVWEIDPTARTQRLFLDRPTFGGRDILALEIKRFRLCTLLRRHARELHTSEHFITLWRRHSSLIEHVLRTVPVTHASASMRPTPSGPPQSTMPDTACGCKARAAH